MISENNVNTFETD